MMVSFCDFDRAHIIIVEIISGLRRELSDGRIRHQSVGCSVSDFRADMPEERPSAELFHHRRGAVPEIRMDIVVGFAQIAA